MISDKKLSALVLSGGGARGAYEAGVMNYVCAEVLRNRPHAGFDIYCGSSVGAINTCYLAATAGLPAAKRGDDLYRTWKNLRQEEIYLRDAGAFAGFLAETIKGITLNLFRNPLSPVKSGRHFNGFFDTKPLPRFISEHVDFAALNANVENGMIKAVSLTATNMHSDNMELFVKKRPEIRYTGPYPVNETPLAATHAMASAAIPMAFPPVKLGRTYYMDGGMRLNTPLSPAIQLGADKIFIVGLHNAAERRHQGGASEAVGYVPTLGDIMGKVLNSIFIDRVEYDLEQLNRINRMIAWSKTVCGKDYVSKINEMLGRKAITGDIADRGLKELKVFSVFPSRDVRQVFGECLSDDATYGQYFGSFEKLLLRVLDVDLIQGRDFLSYLMFLPNYLLRLLELGYGDARKKRSEIEAFFDEG